MDCPNCSGTLNEIENEGVTLDFCDDCKGLWFDRHEVADYFELSRDLPELDGVDRQLGPSRMSCPRCKTTMNQILYAPPNQLTLDRCETCGGMWFDRGEVPQLHRLSAQLEDPRSRFSGLTRNLKARGYQIVGFKGD
ncbi:MAG: hypothetical protein CMP23_14685 [Rickettsiales bacterium]|nr:hypothetical protein [Rickettsiales bacterium]|tara:strand:+ start:1137 stop:1547 length:411 start_codon:yes stop_codon:yes gene_type:complete